VVLSSDEAEMSYLTDQVSEVLAVNSYNAINLINAIPITTGYLSR